MYAIVDRPVSQLDYPGQMLIWAMRSWVASVERRQCPGSTLGPAFAQHNMLAGLQPFLRMMATLNRHGLEDFEFHQLACNRVSEHEALLLQALGQARSTQAANLAKVLPLIVDEESTACLLDAMLTIGKVLNEARFGTSISDDPNM